MRCSFVTYMPPASPSVPDALVACDFRQNHRGERRNVLYSGMHVARMTEAEFQAELARPENAAFAAALRAVEGR